LIITVLQTKLQKLIQGDKFKMEREFLIELEELSNIQGSDSVAAAQAKVLVIESMLRQG